MALHVDKPRADPWWQIIHESSDEVEKPVDNAVKRTISKFQSWSLGEMERRLKKNQQSAAVDAVDWKGFQESLEQELHQRIQRSMKKTARESANKLGLDFDPSDKKLLRAAKLRARKSARLITNESRQALKETIKEYSKQGLTPRQIRSRVRPMLGLTRRQAYSLRHQEKLMRAKGASHAQIQKKLKGLSKRYAKQRSSYIARFEGLGASQQGADTVISTAMAEGDIEHVEKKWIRAARDSCQICRRLNGQRVEFNARFIDPKTKKRYDNPPDPHGNCRCGLHYYFKKVPQGQHVAASEFFHAQHDQMSHGRKGKARGGGGALSYKEAEAVGEYVGDPGVNRFLRNPDNFPHPHSAYDPQVKHMDAAMAKSVLEQDTELTRMVDDKGYISTSASDLTKDTQLRNEMEEESGLEGMTRIVKIRVPAGSKGLDVNSRAAEATGEAKSLLGTFSYQNEVILPRGQTWKVKQEAGGLVLTPAS